MSLLDIAATAVLAAISAIAGAVVGIFVVKYCGDILIPVRGIDAERWASATAFGIPAGALAGLYAALQLRQTLRNWLLWSK